MMKASRYNKENPEQTETETVAASVKKNQPATCEEDGEIIYTATFKNQAFGTREITVKENKKGHKYAVDTNLTVNPERIFEENEFGDEYMKGWKAGKLVEVCENDSSHTKETPLLVELALTSEVETFRKVNGTYVLDITEMIEPEEINSENTVLSVCYWFLGIATYSSYTDAGQGEWYLDDESEYYQMNSYPLVIDPEYEDSDGVFVVDNNINLEDIDGEYTFTLTVKPKKADIYKETSYKVTIKLPDFNS